MDLIKEYLGHLFNKEVRGLHIIRDRTLFKNLTPITCLDHIPFGLLLFGPSRYKFTVKIRALACPVLRLTKYLKRLQATQH